MSVTYHYTVAKLILKRKMSQSTAKGSALTKEQSTTQKETSPHRQELQGMITPNI